MNSVHIDIESNVKANAGDPRSFELPRSRRDHEDLVRRLYDLLHERSDADLRDRHELARADIELMRLGYPSWGNAPYHISGLNALMYDACLERRAWLASSKVALSRSLGHGWRYVVGPTWGYGSRGELIIPARVVVVNQDLVLHDEERKPTDDDREIRYEAWWLLHNEASRAAWLEIDTADYLGLTLDTCERELGSAHAACGKKPTRF